MSESDGGFWPTAQASDAHRGPESRETKKARGAGGINQAQAVKIARWQTPKAAEAMSGQQARGGDRKGELLLGGQIKAARWQTCVAEDKEQSNGSAKRGPTQTSQVRASLWATPNARDAKDTGATQGNRKSPNLGTQVNAARTPDAGHTPC